MDRSKECIYNEGIRCTNRRTCTNCGWNPEVIKRREEIRRRNGVTPCPYNEAVDCRNHAECDECGWNPLVAERRETELMEELGLEA